MANLMLGDGRVRRVRARLIASVSAVFVRSPSNAYTVAWEEILSSERIAELRQRVRKTGEQKTKLYREFPKISRETLYQ